MPAFIAAIVGAVGSWLARNTGRLFLFGTVAAYLSAVVAITVWFVQFVSDVYSLVVTKSSEIGSSVNAAPDTLKCLIHNLGLDVWFTSFFSIMFTAGAFWIFAVANVIAYKTAQKMRSILVYMGK